MTKKGIIFSSEASSRHSWYQNPFVWCLDFKVIKNDFKGVKGE